MESYDAYAKLNLDPTSYPIVGSINSLNEKLKNVNASKVVDENGEPLVVYHGSRETFEVFDKSKIGKKWGDVSDLGFYFTVDKNKAAEYREGQTTDVYEMFLNLRNPQVVEDEGWGSAIAQTDARHSDLKRWAEAEHNDGIAVISNDEILEDDNGREFKDAVYVAFEPNQIKDATGRNVGFNPESGNIYLQMAGQKALTANEENLQRAMAMWEEAKSQEEIFKETGWVHGIDGKWRFEIPDLFNNIDPHALEIPENKMMGASVKLSDMYNNPQLYEAYPWLRNIDVVVAYPEALMLFNERKNMDTTWGFADYDNDMIVINADKLGKTNDTEIRKNLLHEIQHLIQEEEGFARGGGTSTVVRSIEKEIENLKNQARDIHPDAFAYYNREAELDRALLLGSEDELEEARKSMEDFERNTSMTEKQKEKAWKVCARINSLQKQLERGRENPYRLYRLLAGEQEAESTAMRGLNLQLAKDRGEYEAELQNLPSQPFNAIVVFNGEEMPLQSAWHGTPNDFDAFSTDYMGSGEGAQAHGWGLYFAKNRQVSEEYKRKLSDYTRDYRIRSDGNIVKNITRVINRYLGGSELAQAADNNNSEPLKTNLRNVIKDLSNENAFNPKTIRALKEQIKRIEDNPKLSVTAFLKGAPEDDWRYATIVKSAKAAAKAEGRKVTIADVKTGLENHLESFENVRSKELEDLKVLQGINFDTLQVERSKGTLFEVDIPDDDVLLDEQKPFAKQPRKVIKGIRNLLESMSDEQIEKMGNHRKGQEKEKAIFDIGYNYNSMNVTGREIYEDLTQAFGSPKAASEALNKAGIKGITYDGRRDGRCFVVFDDKAISVLNKYYQQQGGVKGSTSFSETTPLKTISLFQTADRSTFLHEMSHAYLLDLERLAAAAPDSRFAKDYATVTSWASWTKGMAEEYKGTSSYEEFRKREQNIQEAQIKGDTETEEKLLKEWAQERFARGFEEYLRKGEAPAVVLQKAFQNFKKWLTNIYKSFIGAGVRATPEVEAVMARMLASEEEIQIMNEISESNRLTGLDGLDMAPTEVAAMYSRWQEKARTMAEEQLLKELLKDYKKNVQDKLQEHEAQLREEITRRLLMEEPCYAVDEAVAQGADLNNALFMYNLTSREYDKRKKELGGDLEKAVNRQVKAEMEAFQKQMPNDQVLHDQAMQAMYSGENQLRLAELERQILRRYKERYMEAPQILQKGLHELDNAREKATPELMKRKLAELKYSIRWNDAQWNIVKKMEDLLATETGETVSPQKLEAFDKKYNELKASTVQNKDWLRKVRGGTMEAVDFWKRSARQRLEEMTLTEATNYEHWIREGEKQAVVAGQEFSKAQKNKGKEAVKHAEKAEQAKQKQAAFVAMTAESIAMKKKVGQWIGKIRNRQKSMAAGKEKMDPALRYFHDHVLWVYGLQAADARKPVTLGNRSFTELIQELMQDELQLGEEKLPAWLVAAADATERESKGYRGLNMSDFQDLMNFTTWLYTLSKNQTQLLTMDVTMEQVEGECFKDWRETVYVQRAEHKVSEIRKQQGRYMAMIVKPETWLNVLGGKEGAFVRYIYIPLLKAAEAEEIAQEKEAKFLRGYDVKKPDGTTEHVKGLYEQYYSKEELRKIGSEKLTDDNGKTIKIYYGLNHNEIMELTKENILCMALNWGNRTNRSRLCRSMGMSESAVQGAYLEKFLTVNDWNFVQAMWDHINEFAAPASAVLEKSTGLPMKRVEADAFTVRTEDGELSLKGGYYPIVKDVDRSLREVEFEKMEQAQSMGGASVFGVGMGSTKERSQSNLIDDPLILELRVAHSHIRGMIHIINSRMAVRDAYKVLHNKEIQAMIANTLGTEAYKAMDEWVLANWHAPMQQTNQIREWSEKIRSKTVGAIMAYRISTALLNLANGVYMAQEIGAANTVKAVVDYYKDWRNNAEFVENASVYMRNRDTNMDRDLNVQSQELLKNHGKLMNKLNDVTGDRVDDMSYFVGKYANWMIEKTDAIFSKE